MVIVLCLGAPTAWATTHVFEPPDPDLGDMPHNKYYAWGIQTSIPNGDLLTGARIDIKGINDWSYGSNDVLYIRLVNELPAVPWDAGGSWPGLKVGTDGWNGPPQDRFAGYGVKLAEYVDPNRRVPEDWSYVFDPASAEFAALKTFLQDDGIYGLTFDPDCRYCNCGVEMTLVSAPVPEPLTVVGVFLGVGGLASYVRRRRLA
jgi:hypothetical protein